MRVEQIVGDNRINNLVQIGMIIRILEAGPHRTIITSDGNAFDVTDSFESIEQVLLASKE
jgi:hypothetical protein